MRNEATDTLATVLAGVTATPTETPAPAPTEAPAATAKPKRERKPKAAKPVQPAKRVAKPAPAPADATNEQRRAERIAAASAVREYYAGRSLPFKSASDRFVDLRTDKAPKAATERQAALIAAMLAADTAGNIKRDGTFVRGGFRLPARLFDPKADASAVVACQPETGCLSDMLGRVVTYVSGPTSGKAQRDTVLRLNLKLARDEIGAKLGDKLAKPALARIDALTTKRAA